MTGVWSHPQRIAHEACKFMQPQRIAKYMQPQRIAHEACKYMQPHRAVHDFPGLQLCRRALFGRASRLLHDGQSGHEFLDDAGGGVALDEGLIDELHLLLWPVVVGAGKPALPRHDKRKAIMNYASTTTAAPSTR